MVLIVCPRRQGYSPHKYNKVPVKTMSDNEDNQDENKNIISFPEKEKRKAFAKKKEKEEKESAKERKERERQEEEYRRQYREERAARARLQSKIAQGSASGKQPFINWDRIPPFSRSMIVVFLIVHLLTVFLFDEATRYDLTTKLGFVPAYYTGALPWSWTALLGPFTTLFMHGGWMHLLINSVMMMAMGVFFERQFGARRTFIFFIACGMAGNVVYFLLNPTLAAPVIGASGAISGLFGATMMMMTSSGLVGPEAQKRGPMPFILLWVSIIVITGAFSADTAWQSHLGGFLGGIGFYQLWRKGHIKF